MSLILGRFKNKRRLGGGAFGDVQLATDQNNKQFALKIISKKIFDKQPFLLEYIQGQKQCMMSLKSPYVVQLYGVQEDQNRKYFICQYCDGGDLLCLQAKQPNKVFTLKEATKIICQVILGLQHVHKSGYLHRDIKLQNILVKKDENGKMFYKLADFGFAKKIQNISGTVLGTQNYMSPEIFQNQVYSYEVDMWAFGVLFYFMLNMEFPYTFSPHSSISKKRQDIISQTSNFSYKEKVKNSNKQIMQNCTPELQDLFKRIFQLDWKKRINFGQIRSHPIFKQYFPNADKQINFYNSVQTKKPKNRINDKFKQISQQNPETVLTPSIVLKKNRMNKQIHVLQLEFQRIRFLDNAADQIQGGLNFVAPEQMMIFKYNVLKYYLVLLRNFKDSLTISNYQEKYPSIIWDNAFKSKQFSQLIQDVTKQISQSEVKLAQSYNKCKKVPAQTLSKINPKFIAILASETDQTQFTSALKASYRCSTSALFAKLRQKINISNVWAYLTLLVFMIHAFNNIVKQSEDGLKQLFPDFYKKNSKDQEYTDFEQLRAWMKESEKEQLKVLIATLNKKYFT